MQEVCRRNPKAIGIIMGQHGLINWSDDDRECYYRSLDLIEKAAQYIEKKYAEKGGDATAFGGQHCATLPEDVRRKILARLLPWLRGQVSAQKRLIATIQDDEKVFATLNSKKDARASGRARHKLSRSFSAHQNQTALYRHRIGRFFQSRRRRGFSQRFLWSCSRRSLRPGWSNIARITPRLLQPLQTAQFPAMRNPNPTVMLIPGVGMIAWGKDKSESRVTAEFYNCAIEVIGNGSEAIDRSVLPCRSRRRLTSSIG